MNELLPLSVGLGLAISLLFTEVFGVAAGGMIVPGYIALAIRRPADVAATLLAGFLTFAVVRTLSAFTIVYGRRRTVLMILVGYLMGMGARWLSGTAAPGEELLSIVGFIIPGLIAIWFDRQGVVETIAALITASAAVRLVLVLLVGMEVRG